MLDLGSRHILTRSLGSKMALRNLRSRFSRFTPDAPARIGSLAWRRVRWGWIFLRSKYFRRHDAEILDSAYFTMRKRLFDERQLASEAFYWATIRDQVEAAKAASTRNLASLQ